MVFSLPKIKPPRIARTDKWRTIKQRSLWPEQVAYEMIRPVVLFSETPAERANVWLSKEHLTVEYGDEPLSQYAVQYQPDDKHLRDIREPHHFETSYRTPQLDLWQSGVVEWHLVKRLPDSAPRSRKRRAVGKVVQAPFADMDVR